MSSEVAHGTPAADLLAEQTAVDSMMQIGRALLEAGRHAWARETFYLATRFGPIRASALSGLAGAREAVIADGSSSIAF